MYYLQDTFGSNVKSYKDSILVKFRLAEPTVEYMEANMRLGDYLHPSLKERSEFLEYSIVRQRMATEMLLHHYSVKVMQRQWDVTTLGEILMYNYAMFSNLARSSRAYCIGLQYSVNETVAAAALNDRIVFLIGHLVLDIKHNRTGFDEGLKNMDDFLKNKQIPSVFNSGILIKR